MSFNTTGLWHLIEWQVVNLIAFKTLTFQDFRRKHIEAELNKFDRAVKSKQEVLKWGWSPLFQVFLKWPLHNYDPGHWDNTEEEWSRMSSILLQNINLDAQVLDKECPDIVKNHYVLDADTWRTQSPARPSNDKFKSRPPLWTRKIPWLFNFFNPHVHNLPR